MRRVQSLVMVLAATLLAASCERQEPAEPDPAGASEPVPQEAAARPASSGTPAAESPAAEPASEAPEHIAAAIAHPDRPEADKARDGGRRPGQVLSFLGLEPGMTVLEFVAAGGYYTEILARAVGDDGHVYATRLAEERGADERLPNVTAAEDRDWGLEPGSVDLIFTALNWHDLHNIEDVDRPALLQRFHEVLKPGGVFGVIDHAAEEGSGGRDTDTLHRIDEHTVITEFTDAGFELADTSDALRHPEDDRTRNVFADGLRGETDRFLLKFVKRE